MNRGEHRPARQVFTFSARDISGEIWYLGECSAHSRAWSCILPDGPIPFSLCCPFSVNLQNGGILSRCTKCYNLCIEIPLAAFHICMWIVPESVTAQAVSLKTKFWVTHSPQSTCCNSQLVLICCKKSNADKYLPALYSRHVPSCKDYMAACVTSPRLPIPEFYFLAVSYNFLKYFLDVIKSLQLHSHYKFCQGWLWIILCSLEHKIRIFIAATVNSIGSKESSFLPSIKSWISCNWGLPLSLIDFNFIFFLLPSVLLNFFFFFFLVMDVFV